jgi:hypothetical protein
MEGSPFSGGFVGLTPQTLYQILKDDILEYFENLAYEQMDEGYCTSLEVYWGPCTLKEKS